MTNNGLNTTVLLIVVLLCFLAKSSAHPKKDPHAEEPGAIEVIKKRLRIHPGRRAEEREIKDDRAEAKKKNREFFTSEELLVWFHFQALSRGERPPATKKRILTLRIRLPWYLRGIRTLLPIDIYALSFKEQLVLP